MSNRRKVKLAADGQLPRADRMTTLFAPATVVLFAGLGGVCIGEERAYVRGGYRDKYVDLCVNHWDTAVGVHELNHPMTQHLRADVLEVDPNEVLPGRRIVKLHLSPDCTDFSKAKGSRPKRKHIRALAWVGIDWAAKRRPDVITLENVEEFKDWGPLGRDRQPCPRRRGATFRQWVRALEGLGYVVEWREMRACDYGAPTTRKRLFVLARCDGKPIVWPAKTHGPAGSGLLPYRTAAECIDWSHPMLSVFATRKEAKAWSVAVNVGRVKHERVGIPQRPLKPKTQQRLARGLLKFVLEAKRPFIVDIQNYGWDSTATRDVGAPMPTVTASPRGGGFAAADAAVAEFVVRCAHGDQGANGSKRWGNGEHSSDQPLPTVSGSKDFAVAAAHVAPFTAGVGGRAGQSPATSGDKPLPTVTAKGDRVVAAAQVACFTGVFNHGGNEHRCSDLRQPANTVTGANDARGVVGAKLAPYTIPNLGEREGQAPRCASLEQPSPTVTAKGNGARLVAAHLVKHYTGVVGSPLDRPADTVTAVDHHAVAAVHLSQYHDAKGNEVRGQSPDEPIRTLDTQPRFAPVAAHLLKFRGDSPGTAANAPIDTITAGSSHGRPAGAGHAMGAQVAYLSHFYTSNTCGGEGDPARPAKTITSGGQHALVACAFISAYYGSGSGLTGHRADVPSPTVTGNDRLGVATAMGGWPLTQRQLVRAKQLARWSRRLLGVAVERHLIWVHDPACGAKPFPLLRMAVEDGPGCIVWDLAMRMLKPRELARAQGFPDSYVIDRTSDGKRISNADQVKLIGNSVPPQFSEAIAYENVAKLGVLDTADEGVAA